MKTVEGPRTETSPPLALALVLVLVLGTDSVRESGEGLSSLTLLFSRSLSSAINARHRRFEGISSNNFLRRRRRSLADTGDSLDGRPVVLITFIPLGYFYLRARECFFSNIVGYRAEIMETRYRINSNRLFLLNRSFTSHRLV